MNILIALFLILFEAVPEALSGRGKKTLAGVLEFIYLAVVTFVVFAYANNYHFCNLQNGNLWYILIGYTFLRYAIFDMVYNTIRGNPLFHIGNTKLIDKAQSWLIAKWGYTIILVTKFIALLWGVAWLLGWQEGIR